MQGVDQRAQQLQSWAVDWLQRERPGLRPAGDLQVVSGDASFRRYFRLPLEDGALIAVDAPPDKENSRPFVAIARALRAHGVQVPEVVAADFGQGFMLLQDFGDTLVARHAHRLRSGGRAAHVRSSSAASAAGTRSGKSISTCASILPCGS